MNDSNNTPTEETSTAVETAPAKSSSTASKSFELPEKLGPASKKLNMIKSENMKSSIPEFRVGDTVKVHARIIEGNKERIQIFEGAVIKRQGKTGATASFTVRKISFNIGVERTFLLHSPRIDKIEVVTKGIVRRARLFYLRPLRGKAAKIRGQFMGGNNANAKNSPAATETAAETVAE